MRVGPQVPSFRFGVLRCVKGFGWSDLQPGTAQASGLLPVRYSAVYESLNSYWR